MVEDCPECSPKNCACSPCACGSGEAAGKCCGDRLKANRGDPDPFEKAWGVVKSDPKCKKCKKPMTPYSAGTWWCMDCPFEDGMPTQEYSSGDFE